MNKPQNTIYERRATLVRRSFNEGGSDERRALCIHDCGLAEYREILQLQHELRDKRREGKIPNTVLIVEHQPIITLGARQSANKLMTSREELAQHHIDIVNIRRGGGTTAHNPGQLVFYPILNLQQLGLGITEYIRELETIGIELLEQLSVAAHRRRGFPGLWVTECGLASSCVVRDESCVERNTQNAIRNTQYAIRKIASIGVRVSKFITYHGMAINIHNDLSIFDFIVPCGLDDIEMTSVMKETGKWQSMTQVKQRLCQLLKNHFLGEDPCSSSVPSTSLGAGVRDASCVERNTQYAIRNTQKVGKLPPWLRRPLPAGDAFRHTEQVLSSLGLETICSNANCPNRGECWARGTATVLILGNICTRNCKFCSLTCGRPAPPDPTEPGRIAEMAKQMRLKYLIITSVNRDDLSDGGAGHFRDCINKVRQQCPDMKFEILTPDFRNCQAQALKILHDALPFVFAHNVETVPALYPIARAGGNYQRSLNLLRMAKEAYHDVQTKSSIMLGLGETDAQVEQVLKDLRKVGCDRITIGQYLKPSKNSFDVVEYVIPAKFDWWKQKAMELGFSWITSSPFTRSSYFAEQQNTL